MDRKATFLSNPKNAHFKNNGNSNININGNNNQVADTINNYNNTIIKKPADNFTPDYNIHISSEQARTIQLLVKDIVDKEVIGGMSNNKAFPKWQNQLRNYMKVNSYLAIKIEDYDKAIAYLRKQNVLKRSKTRRNNNEYWRNDIYSSIYTRANQLNISKDDLYNIVHERYNIKINSLKELGEQNLDKLRVYIYSLKG